MKADFLSTAFFFARLLLPFVKWAILRRVEKNYQAMAKRKKKKENET